MEFRCIGMSSSHSHSQVSIKTILWACVRKLPGFNECGRCIFIPFSPGMQPAWPGEPEALPQLPPPAKAIISLLLFSDTMPHKRVLGNTTKNNDTFNTTVTQNDRMTLYRQTPDGVPFIMMQHSLSQDVLAAINFLSNKTSVLGTKKGRPV